MPASASWTSWFVVLLAAAAMLCQAAEEPMAKGLQADPDNRLWTRMISSLNIRVDEDMSYATMFAPTDRAVQAFLHEMGLSFEELLAQPVLVDQVLSYHLVPGVAMKNFYVKNMADRSKDLISRNPDEPTQMTTGDVNDLIQGYVSPTTGLITLLDAQGYRAVVVGGGTAIGNVIFYDISAVLMSSSYFFNSMGAFRYYPQWSAAADLMSKAALYSDTLAATLVGNTENTFLLPNNYALQPVARALVSAPAADLVALMEYHVVPGIKAVPEGWKSDAVVGTKLAGYSLTSRLSTTEVGDYYSDEKVQAPLLTLVPEIGKPAQVEIMNIYAGRSIILGLNGALLHSTTIAKVAAGATAGTSGRHLLQRHRSGSRGHANNWSAQNTQRAIRAAARGDIPVSYATRAGSRNAQLAGGGCANCWRWGM